MRPRTMRALAECVAIPVLALGLAGCGANPIAPTGSPSLGPERPGSAGPPAVGPSPAGTFQPGDPVPLARTTEALTPRWGPNPDGPQLRDEFGRELVVLDRGVEVVVLGDAQPGPDGAWVPIYVIPDDNVWPNDFVGWIPAVRRGQATLERVEREACPPHVSIGWIAPLLPIDRRRCLGPGEITVTGKTWRPTRQPAYDADPSWLGARSDLRQTVAVYDAGPDPFGAGSLGPADGATLDARTPPGIEPPPLDMIVRVTGHFDDPAAMTCTRRFHLELGPGQVAQPGWGVPPEDPSASVAWCRDQFVVSAWAVELGPEGRPLDPAAPQLHRMSVDDGPAAVPIGCAGVGLPPLTVRIDLSKIDPVWLDVQWGGRSAAVFSKRFRLVTDPFPVVVAPNGVTLTNGERLGANGEKAGLSICTGGDAVSFWARAETN